METVFGHNFFYLLVSGWFNDTQNPPMMEAECQKIISICLIYKRIFVSFENIFVSELFLDYVFHLVFTKNIHENSVGRRFVRIKI